MDDYEGLKRDIYALTKIDLNAYKERQMRRRIDSLVVKRKCSTYKEYIALLKSDKAAFEEFINFMTINVSEFYRNPDQWELMDKEYIPELINKFGKNLRIWSAACSTGDEPYSLVMAFSRHLPLSNIKIIATDIDKQVISQAKTGIYNAKSIAGVPEDLKKKYFTQVGNSWQISEEIKKCVTFQEHNLLASPYPKDCDFIICRNVVIYFTDDAKTAIYKKFLESLKPGGLLFIGNTEQILEYKELGYERRTSFYYEKPIK